MSRTSLPRDNAGNQDLQDARPSVTDLTQAGRSRTRSGSKRTVRRSVTSTSRGGARNGARNEASNVGGTAFRFWAPQPHEVVLIIYGVIAFLTLLILLRLLTCCNLYDGHHFFHLGWNHYYHRFF